ncbi:MAG: zinc ribbon domain-containing protein [Candidatus Adiutrix sp.]|jgi:putative FmdB family regulatory protein|nr:zinc ribbon domain-containing protein [Candidatus Adiutrix sp.]
MPIYEYQCQKCGETTEIMQKFSEPPLRKCPACGGRLAKLMSMNSFQLKGSGWYVTDYTGRKGEAAPKEAAAAGSAPEAKTAPETPKESRTGAKAKAPKEAPAKA